MTTVVLISYTAKCYIRADCGAVCRFIFIPALKKAVTPFGHDGREGAMANRTYLISRAAISLFLLILFISTTAHAKIIYVDDDASGLNDGTCWNDAYNYLQNALAVAQSGDEIRVGQGIYTPADPVTPVPPGQASNPDPKDGATGVSIDAALSWTAGTGATSHDIYFGTSISLPFVRNQTATTFYPVGMAYNTTYYWRIDSVNVWGKSTGAVWSFTTGEAPQPPPPPPPPLPMNLSNGQTEEVASVDRAATFQLINGVAIKGGYAGFSEPDPNARDIDLYETILCGDIGTAGYWPDNCYHVVTANGVDETAVLDGFVITCGFANIGHDLQYIGGGMLNKSSNPTVINCTFINNSAIEGGGMGNLSSSPALTNCNFIGNRAHSLGAGLCNSYESSPILTNCTFIENSVKHSGGGMANVLSSPTLTECTFTGNSASYGGGMDNSGGKPSMRNCIFSGNSADYGGGIYNWESSPRMTNCIFSGNRANLRGGGIYVRVGFGGPGGGCYMNNFCNVTLINCIFVENLAENGRFLACASCDNKFPSKVQISNCILWNGEDEIRNYDGTTITITYSDIWGGFTGEGNIDADPCFVDPGYWYTDGVWVDGDYHLLPDSPCINAGDPNHPYDPNETDLDDKPRIIGGRIDMGAYEYLPLIPAGARFIPHTVNLASKGKWIACYIWLPEDYDVADIDPNSILLENEIEPERFWINEEQQVAMARFSRSEVQLVLNIGEVELAITGKLTDGTLFEAQDNIKVIDKGGRKPPK